MRCVAITLTALLFLTGTQARYVWQNEEPKGPANWARDFVQSYVKVALEYGKEVARHIETSEYGKKLDLKIADKMDAVSTNAQNLQKQLAPYIDQAREQIATEYAQDLSVAKEKIQPILEQFQKRWEEEVKAYQQKMAPLREQLQQQARDNLEGWSKKLLPVAAEFRDKLRSEVEKLRTSIEPVADEVREQVAKKLEQLRVNAGPQAEAYRAKWSERIDAWSAQLGPVAQELKERLIPHAEDVRSKLNSWLESLRKLAPAV